MGAPSRQRAVHEQEAAGHMAQPVAVIHGGAVMVAEGLAIAAVVGAIYLFVASNIEDGTGNGLTWPWRAARWRWRAWR